ncbi:hypothetical protein [Saccharopolyspora griseoalba]|uniref:Uncharacterized protein n=1 Tax=Saccharopolyspora griseoalba TaxID=1431848 RepID=A0ABW2LUB8_9PSEU
MALPPSDQSRFEAELDHIYTRYRQGAQEFGASEAMAGFFAYFLQQRRPEAVAGLLATALDRMHRSDFDTLPDGD